MALKDRAVLTASTGFIYTGSVGLASPSPAEIAAFDPVTFGCVSYEVEITAVTGTITAEIGPGPETSSAIPFDASAATIQTALEAIPSVGAGNVLVEPLEGGDPDEFLVTFVGQLQGVDPVLDFTTGATATVSTALNGWTMLGHTSREDLPEFGNEGGDSEVKGTWQNATLKEVQTEAISDYVVIKINQIDRSTFLLYYGPSSTPSVPGVYGVAGNPVAVERALLVVIVDGDVNLGFNAPKASFKREDAFELATDEFAAFPVRATFLKHGTRDLYRWISEDLFD